MKAYLVFSTHNESGTQKNTVCATLEDVFDVVEDYLDQAIEDSEFPCEELDDLELGGSMRYDIENGNFIAINLVTFDPELVITVEGGCVMDVESVYEGIEYTINDRDNH
jgi:hypothetical protein